jgi:hypothetical protein
LTLSLVHQQGAWTLQDSSDDGARWLLVLMQMLTGTLRLRLQSWVTIFLW